MGDQPPARVIDVDVDLGIVKQRLHLGILFDQPKISRIDFNDLKAFDVRMIGDNLRPRTGGKAEHEGSAWMRMEETQDIGANDKILVVVGIDVEVSIIYPAAKNRIVISHRNDAVAVFDDVLHVSDF